MKTNYAFKLIFLLLLSISSFASSTLDITINQERKVLVAPEGTHYQWYKNDQVLMGESGKELLVTESGEYKVEVGDEKGEVSAPSITVAVNAMGAIIKIYTIGDSTVQDYNAGYYPRKGWGQVLPAFFNTANVQVVNKAVGGTSSKSFYNNHWAAVRDLLVAGDFVFIQFGINDRNNADPARYAPTGGEFESYLTKFVNETKAKGAFPVLVSTARRNAWNADGVTVYDSYHDHPVAVRTTAKSLGVPLIDLDAKAKVAMEAAGQLYCTRFWSNTYPAGEYANYPNGNTDQVHFQEMGAINNASLIVQGIKELSADVNVGKLIPYLKPQYTLTTSVNPTGSDDATTRTASYPQGLTITLKTLPKTGKAFQKWNNASGAQFATTTLTTITSGISATSYQAVYAGAANCTATLDNCDRCTGGATGNIACSRAAEIESEACSFEGVTEATNMGFKGAGYVNVPNALGATIVFKINSLNAGLATLSFRYANGGANDRPAQVMLNGTALSTALSFPSTTAFTSWSTVDLKLTLIKGVNELKLVASTADGLPNLDQIGYVTTGLERACITTDYQDLPMNESTSVFPNPFSSYTEIFTKGPFDYQVYDRIGNEVEKGSAYDVALVGRDLKSGIYQVRILQGGSIRLWKISKL